MFCAMLGLYRWWPETRSIWLLLILALAVRIGAVFQFPHGDDIHRYIWEGKIQLKGYNPFEHAPKAKVLKHLRNESWKEINHKRLSTIYWPFAQQLFKLTARISPSVTSFKTVFLLFDMGIIIILLLLLKHLSISYNHLLLYALNPFPIIYTAGEGHLEIVMVFWIILGIYFWHRNRYGLMYLSLGLAVMTKMTPVILLPFLIQRKNIHYLLLFFVPFLFVIPYVQNNVSFFTIPMHFLEIFRYNGLVYTLIRQGADKQQSLYYCSILMFGAFGLIFFVTPHPIKAASLAVGAFLIFTPAFHPWYLLLMTPFLVLYRSPPWLTLHLTILPLVFVFNRFALHTFWRDKILMMYIEYTPFVIVGLWYIFKGTRHWPVQFTSPKNISVVIPVYNEEKHIAECIKAVQIQSVDAEIIVVDGGSTDTTRDIVQSLPSVKLLTSQPGRGIQIEHGLQQAGGDVIVVLHADSRLKQHAFSRLLSALNANPEAVGGAFGAVYEHATRRFKLTELLNNLRTKLVGIAFGDQAQFFRKEAVRNYFPAYKLMEDIELSFRLKEKGALLFIPDGVVSSTRTWKQVGYVNNFLKIILLSSYYIIRRKFGLLTPDCADFYGLYYGKK